MDVSGSEINQKMRSAIKAKLTELGCYVDDELPDYVMVMVANKRTRIQMEADLNLFLGTNTELFVSWLHQVLKKLQEVTINTAPKPSTLPTVKEDAKSVKATKPKSSSKEKTKEKKEKRPSKEKDKHHKKSITIKKSKKEAKKKIKDKKKITKTHKSKKKTQDEIIRPNVPPLLMNLEKDSEPSITDVFAGQILKNHGITLEQNAIVETKTDDVKPTRKALKRNRFPIIDPATVTNVTESETALPSEEPSENIVADTAKPPNDASVIDKTTVNRRTNIDLETLPIEDQIREMNEIEAKIQGLKKKLADQLDSMSEDEDFLNIRTEAEELMNDFAEDVIQEITAAQTTTTAAATPPLVRPPTPSKPVTEEPVFPQIELQLPKRPMRERLGLRPDRKEKEKRRSSGERDIAQNVQENNVPSLFVYVSKHKNSILSRYTPEKEPHVEERLKSSVHSRLGEAVELNRKRPAGSDSPEKREEPPASRRLLSKISVLEARETGEVRVARAGPASVVRVRPRPRLTPGAPAPNLLMRAVADAHKSLLNVPPKIDKESKVKKALVLPMRRNVEAQKIVIQVQSDRIPSPDNSECEIDLDTDSLAEFESDVDKNSNEYVPEPIKKTITQSVRYVPSHASDSSTLEEDTIKIHNPTVGSEKGPQFVVTLDGLDPNVFLAKKLKTEGLADESLTLKSKKSKKNDLSNMENTKISRTVDKSKNVEKQCESIERNEGPKNNENKDEFNQNKVTNNESKKPSPRKSSKESSKTPEKRKSVENDSEKKKSTDITSTLLTVKKENSPVRKRKASPIVFDVKEREERREREKRERKESAGSDITVTTSSSSHKYDSLPSLPSEKRLPCRTFPACRFGTNCAFTHPPCKFSASCTRRDCAYSHASVASVRPPPVVASHVVPVTNYKSITPVALPNLCKFYPACVNPACHFFHPKPCRYGNLCTNKPECNFYHHAGPSATRWRSPFKV